MQKEYADWRDKAVGFTPKLAVLINRKGERAIDYAAPECKKAMQDALVRRAREEGKMVPQPRPYPEAYFLKKSS